MGTENGLGVCRDSIMYVGGIKTVELAKTTLRPADWPVGCAALYKVKPPEMQDINIVVPNKVVEVTFTDGKKEKSVCREPDVFSLEQAISICLSKRLMGGSGEYNKAIKQGKKVYENKLKAEEERKREEERIARRREKRIDYKVRRTNRLLADEQEKLDKEKENQIEIQKEAYLRAMREYNNPITAK